MSFPKLCSNGCKDRSQTQGEEHLNLNQGKLVDGLVKDLLNTIHKYDDSLYMATVIGCLEFVKQQLIDDAKEKDNG